MVVLVVTEASLLVMEVAQEKMVNLVFLLLVEPVEHQVGVQAQVLT
jgi:hypothetical protein